MTLQNHSRAFLTRTWSSCQLASSICSWQWTWYCF